MTQLSRFRTLIRRPARSVVLTAVGLTLIGGTVVAQTVPMEPIQWDKRRLDQLDRNVRRLERALTQRNAAGQPVLVEPDPEVIAVQGRMLALEQRLADMENGRREVNAELERLGFELDETKRANTALGDRVRAAEGRVQAFERAAEAAAEEAARNAPIEPDSPTGNAADDLAQASRLAAADPVRGERALLTVAATWPDEPQAREAQVRLGDMRAANEDPAGAVQAYATALQGWPRAPWAAEGVLKLAAALQASDRSPQACTALGDFDRRYAEGATEALRRRAIQLRARAECE